MICKRCGAQFNDALENCPSCGEKANRQANDMYNNYNYNNGSGGGQQQYYQNPYANQYQGQAYPYGAPSNPQFNNFAFQNDQIAAENVSSASTLGIIAIIASFFIPLVSWICGGIGLSKANKYLNYGGKIGLDAASAKKLCLAGIIVACVLFVLSIIVSIIAFWFFFNEVGFGYYC